MLETYEMHRQRGYQLLFALVRTSVLLGLGGSIECALLKWEIVYQTLYCKAIRKKERWFSLMIIWQTITLQKKISNLHKWVVDNKSMIFQFQWSFNVFWINFVGIGYCLTYFFNHIYVLQEVQHEYSCKWGHARMCFVFFYHFKKALLIILFLISL